MSVRELERAVRDGRASAGPRRRAGQGATALAPYCEQIAQELGQLTGRPVEVKLRARGGRVEIRFDGIEDLRRLRDLLVGRSWASPEEGELADPDPPAVSSGLP